MIATCTGKRVLLPKIYSPQERSDAGVKGINGSMLKHFINDTLAQAVEGLDRYPLLLILDRAPIHTNIAALLEEFRSVGSESIKEIILLPPNAAKRLSPLDNALFHDWKEKCRKHTPMTEASIEQVMNDAWAQMDPHPMYIKCGLVGIDDVYFDCPEPSSVHHRHKK